MTYKNPGPTLAARPGFHLLKSFIIKKYIMKTSTFIAALALIGASLGASAAEPIPMGDENREIVAGQPYLIQQYKAASGYYTAPKASIIYVDGLSGTGPYSDPEHRTLVSVTGLDNTGSSIKFNAEEGKTYYFYTGLAMDDATFVLYQEGVAEKPLSVNFMQPLVDQLVDFNNYPDMEITFNQDVQILKPEATISFANRLTSATETLDVRATVSGQTLRVPMYNVLRPYMASGAIKTGDKFTVTVPGLSSLTGVPYSEADEAGNLVMTFLCGSLPVTVTKQTIPSNFLSYWPAGAPEGMLYMEFDAPLISDGKTYIELGWGNQEGDGEYYSEIVECKVEGNSLSADFTGKLRTPALMTPAFPNAMYPTMMINVANIRDEYGVPVASPGSGTTGSYSFNPTYTLIERNSVVGDFEPVNGTPLDQVDNVNVYITGLSSFTFDGFLLTYTDKNNNVHTVTVPLSDVEISDATKTDAIYDFALPAEVKASKRVEITLDNVVSLDGYDHRFEVRCVYGGFAVLRSRPANDETIATLAADSEIYIETNLADEYPNMYVEYQVVDTDPENPEPIVKSLSWMNRQDDNSYISIVPQEVKLYVGHDYRIEFSAWTDESVRWSEPETTLGMDYIIVKGETPAYRYSLVTLKAISPAEGTVVNADLKEIKLTFDGPVYLGNYEEKDGEELRTFINVGQGVTMPFAAVTPVDGNESEGHMVSSNWILEVPSDYMAALTSQLEICFTAFDPDGLQLRGNRGYEQNAFYNFAWGTENMYDAVEVKAVGAAELGDVKEFTVFNKDGVNVSYNVPLYDAVVTFNGEQVAKVADVVLPDIDFSETMTTITLVLDKALTENGTYSLYIPKDFFVIGEQTDIKSSLEVTYEFTIKNGSAVETVGSDNVFTVYNLEGMRILDGADEAAVRALPAGLYIINGHKVLLK